MNTTRVTFGMLNVAIASVLAANLYLFSTHISRTKVDLLPNKKASVPGMFSPRVFLDKINIVLPKKEEPAPDLFKRQGDIITFNTNPTPGLMFRVQIMTSKTPVPLFSHEFKGIDNLKEEYEAGLYKYTVGEFRTPTESKGIMNNLEKKGYDSIFLVAYKDGRPISLGDAIASLKK